MSPMARTAVAAIALFVALSNVIQAASPVTYTTIHVHNMHCADCAKQIARKLYAVPGVIEVRADVANNIAYAVPQKDKVLSPRQLWTAVEAAGFQVAKLESPQGTFKTRPSR